MPQFIGWNSPMLYFIIHIRYINFTDQSALRFIIFVSDLIICFYFNNDMTTLHELVVCAYDGN